MSTSKKDYVAIAAILKGERSCWSKADAPGCPPHGDAFARAALKSVAYQLADHYAHDNPAFDRARFLKACGVA